MQASNNTVYAYQLPSNRQFFSTPNDTDVLVSKTDKITLGNGGECVAIIFFRADPEQLDELKKNMKLNTNQKTIEAYKALLHSMGRDSAAIEKGLAQIKSSAIKTKRNQPHGTSARSSEKGLNSETGKKLLRSKSLRDLVNAGEIASQRAKEKAIAIFGDIPVPANIFESSIRNNGNKIFLINENNQPYKYTPKNEPTKIDIFKPRIPKNTPAPNDRSADLATTTKTTTTPTTTTTTKTTKTDTANDYITKTGYQSVTSAPEKTTHKPDEKSAEKKIDTKARPKPLPKRPVRSMDQASQSKLPNTPPAAPQKKIDNHQISGRNITLPELPDDE